MQKIVTRFAPSPTGFLHIGGIRTAIYNYLFARHVGGKYLVRIEDTDKARSTQVAIDAILQGLDWLGIKHDGEIVYQSHRIDCHKQACEKLMKVGKAYKCYTTPEELEAMRVRAKKQGKTALYDGTWRDKDDSHIKKGTPFTVRLKVDRTDTTMKVRDLIQGEVEMERTHIDDFVLLRSDGSPTYMLSVVVDDMDMGITHVIRGADHLTNTFRQIALYEAFDKNVPHFGHVGLLHGDDGGKLSKRHGALGVDSYRDMGFLPEPLCYYLAGIGCAPLLQFDRVLHLKEMHRYFALDKVSTGGARFSLQKLISLQEDYLRSLAPDVLLNLSWDLVKKRYPNVEKSFYLSCIPILIKRSKNLQELADNASFFIEEVDISPHHKTLEPQRKTLQTLCEFLQDLPSSDWQTPYLQEALKNFSKQEQIAFAKFGKPLRIALTGAPASPGDLAEILVLLGKPRSLQRITKAIEHLQ